MKKILKINEADNVAVVLHELSAQETIEADSRKITIKQTIKPGHKVALQNIKIGGNIIKYGFPIGHATADIEEGSHVHTHNVKTNLDGIMEYKYAPSFTKNSFADRKLTFKGYRRKDGGAGIRNELWIIPTVGCVNGTSDKIVERFKAQAKTIYADNINVLKHNFGCSQLGDDFSATKTILKNAVKHPNAGGVLVLGLGCEYNTPAGFKESLGQFDSERVKFLTVQEVGDEVAIGAALLLELNEAMRSDVRENIPLSELKVGLKCGGSDGFSGITANPLLGRFTDFIVAQGGTSVLTEVPEMFGAETLLMDRAANSETFDKTVKLINNFKQYFISHEQPIYENPSPGNKDGGLTTLEDKSLGCTQKAGKSPVTDVLSYGDEIKTKGLNLFYAPGNDLVASSGLAAAGCQIVLFTTGRGTPFGSFVPTLKVATNTPLYTLKPHWIDFNAGSIVEDVSFDELLESFIAYILRVAGGELVNNEKNNFRELTIWKNGVTL